MAKIKVLLIAASPRGTVPLDLSREFREIDEEVHRGTFRSDVELILVPGARPVDLLRKLNENRPQIVHFSSHGNPDEIVLESGDEEADAPNQAGAATRSTDDRDMKPIRPEDSESGTTGRARLRRSASMPLVNVLGSCDEGNLRMVVLNACHTRPQAEGADRGRRLRRQHEPDNHRPRGYQVRGVLLRGAGLWPLGAKGVRARGGAG